MGVSWAQMGEQGPGPSPAPAGERAPGSENVSTRLGLCSSWL